MGMERIAITLHAMSQISFVDDIERRTFGTREFHHVHAADEKMVVADFGGLGQNRTQFHSGAAVGLFGEIGCRK